MHRVLEHVQYLMNITGPVDTPTILSESNSLMSKAASDKREKLIMYENNWLKIFIAKLREV